MELVKTILKKLCSRELAASTPEYAALLGLLVIAFMLSVKALGQDVGKAMKNVDTRLAADERFGATQRRSDSPAAFAEKLNGAPENEESVQPRLDQVSVSQVAAGR